jgi:hypothetical protein
MTSATARTAANLVLVSAGIVAAHVVFTRPPLRRLVISAAQRWLGANPSVYFLNEVRRAWVESAQAT